MQRGKIRIKNSIVNILEIAAMEKEKHIKNIYGNIKSSHSRDSLKIHFLKTIPIRIRA